MDMSYVFVEPLLEGKSGTQAEEEREKILYG